MKDGMGNEKERDEKGERGREGKHMDRMRRRGKGPRREKQIGKKKQGRGERRGQVEEWREGTGGR